MLVSLTLEDFAREIGIPDADIAAAYESNREQFIEPEQRRIETALFTSKDAAEQAAERVRAGEDFVAVVTDTTGSAPADLGLVTREGALIDEIGAAAFALGAPGIAGPFESPFGWNLARVSDIRPRVEKTLADMRDAITRELAMGRARERIFDVLESFEDALAGGATLENAARENGIAARTIGPVARNGAAPGSERPENADLEMLTALFTQEPDATSPAIERRDGGFFALRVERIDAPRILPLADVRERVVAAWTQEQQAAEAERLAGEIAEQARNGGSLVAAAAKAGFTATKTAPFDRSGQGAEIPTEAVDMVFEAKAGAIVNGAIGDGAVVAQLAEIIAPPADSLERNRLRGALAQGLSNDLQMQLAAALRAEHPVDVDSAELQKLYSPQ